MKLLRYRSEVMVAGLNARMRMLLGAGITPARIFHAQDALGSTPPASRTAPIHHTPPETSAPASHPSPPVVPRVVVAYESPTDLAGLAYPGVLPPTVERWVCDEEGSA